MQITTPINRQIVQRSIYNSANVSIAGTYENAPAKIRCRFVPIREGQGTATGWQDVSFSGGTFNAMVLVRGGWYSIEVEALTSYGVAEAKTQVGRFGVGEVFVVVGHSIAQGSLFTIDGTADDRVNTIPLVVPVEQTKHVRTGLLADMPPIVFGQFGTGVSPAPFGPNCYFWSKFGEYIAVKQNVPVMIFQTAFGGTSLEHWSRSSQGDPFPLFSVNPNIRMPYINLKNTLLAYVAVTGLRSLLIDHGQNDQIETDEDKIFQYYQTFVNQARADVGHLSMAAVINRQTPYLTIDAGYKGGTPPLHRIRRVQERMAASPYCFAGPDMDTGIALNERSDYSHFNELGMAKAAVLWSNALTPAFFRYSEPIILNPVPVEPLAPLPVEATPTPGTNNQPVVATTTPVTVPVAAPNVVPIRTGLVDSDKAIGQVAPTSSVRANWRKAGDIALIALIFFGLGSLVFFIYQSNFINHVTSKYFTGRNGTQRNLPQRIGDR